MPNVALLPVTKNPERLISALEENFRRIANTFQLPTAASSVTAGTFPSGDYTFPEDVVIRGQLRVYNDPEPNSPVLFVGGGGAVEIKGYLDFHWLAAADEVQDYNMRMVNSENGRIRVLHKDGATWGGLSAGTAQMCSYGWDAAWANFGHMDLMDDSSASYQFLAHSNGRIIINVQGGQEAAFFRNGAGPQAWLGIGANNDWCLNNVLLANRANGVRDDIISLGAWGDYMIGVRSETMFLSCYRYISADKRAGGAARMFDWDGDNGLYLHRGWFRPHWGNGVYNPTNDAGEYAWGYRDITTQNNETCLTPRKISQAGWDTAGVEIRGESSSMVPQVSIHASGCCAILWRKDSGSHNMVAIDGNGNCTNCYANSWNGCSAHSKKHHIEVMSDLGLKTIRMLEPKRFKFKPRTELDIWSYEKWKWEKESGRWFADMYDSWEDWNCGYFAHEIAEFLPEAVGYNVDGEPVGVDYGKLVIVAIAAINELAAKVEDLEVLLEQERRHAA